MLWRFFLISVEIDGINRYYVQMNILLIEMNNFTDLSLMFRTVRVEKIITK